VLSFQIPLHTTQSFIGNVPDKKVADDRIEDRRKRGDAKVKFV
jgi:hypothetical protein